MVNVKHKRCGHPGRNKGASFGVDGSKTAGFCSEHKNEAMVDVANKGSKTAKFCAKHKEGMVDVVNKRCGHPGCNKHPSSDVQGSKTADLCAEHKKEGMVIAVSKRCGHPACNECPSYGMEGRKMAKFCNQHKKEGVMDVDNKRCGHPGCNKQLSYGAKGSKTAEFFAANANEGIVNAMSGRVFGGNSGAGGTLGERAGDLPMGRVGEGRKRKDCSPLPAEAGASSVRKHAKGDSGLAAVKVEEDVSIPALPGAVEAVRPGLWKITMLRSAERAFPAFFRAEEGMVNVKSQPEGVQPPAEKTFWASKPAKSSASAVKGEEDEVMSTLSSTAKASWYTKQGWKQEEMPDRSWAGTPSVIAFSGGVGAAEVWQFPLR
eukprot:g13313.t2